LIDPENEKTPKAGLGVRYLAIRCGDERPYGPGRVRRSRRDRRRFIAGVYKSRDADFQQLDSTPAKRFGQAENVRQKFVERKLAISLLHDPGDIVPRPFRELRQQPGLENVGVHEGARAAALGGEGVGGGVDLEGERERERRGGRGFGTT
jgi:hypothetical protein